MGRYWKYTPLVVEKTKTSVKARMHWARYCVTTTSSGVCFDRPRACLMLSNIGLSARLRRKYAAMSPNNPPSTNGKRQESEASEGSRPATKVARAAAAAPISNPQLTTPWNVPLDNPSRLLAACSLTNTDAPGSSPPTAQPCRMRSSKSVAAREPANQGVGWQQAHQECRYGH